MKRLLICSAAVFFCTSVVGCGSIVFGSSNQASSSSSATQTESGDAAQTEAATPDTANAASTTEAVQEQKVDCDTFMKGLADSCFAVMAFEADGKTPLRMRDEAGNDLGEVDPAWVSSYCTCYAQTAFQKFGCSTVMADEDLDDAAYSAKYATIVQDCSMTEAANSAPVAAETPTTATDTATDTAVSVP